MCKETVADLKVKVGELKFDLNNVKTELKNLKEKVASIKPQKVCTYCGAPGHTEAFCNKKKADEAQAAQGSN